MKKLTFNPRTLGEEIVKDSLEAVSQLEKKEPLYLVGGMGVQSYFPTLLRRPTSDLDYSIVRPLGYPGFKEMVKPIQEFLQDKKYFVQPKKGSSASMLFVYDRKTEDGLAIEFARRNKNNFQKRQNILEREFENAKSKIIEGRTKSYTVACPEDLAIPKLVRLINSLERSPRLEELLPDGLKSLSNEDIKKTLRKIADLREETMISSGDIGLVEKLRFISDLYDVRALAEITGFNDDYFNKIEKEWLSIDSKPELRKRIFEVTLPERKFE